MKCLRLAVLPLLLAFALPANADTQLSAPGHSADFCPLSRPHPTHASSAY
jgi:hypothetical protein